jgi:hypothetical protein
MTRDDVVRAVAESALSVDERLVFLELCEARSSEELLADRERVRAYLRVIDNGIEDGESLDGAIAGPVAEALIGLLDHANEWAFFERRVLAGAVEYFVRSDDTDADFASTHGLHDDARVVMAVADALGRQDLVEQLRSALV